MVTVGKSHPGADPVHPLPTSPDPVGANSPPSKRDLASWWKQFKRSTRKEELKEEAPRGIFGIALNVSIKYANVAISLTNDHGESFIYGYVPIVVAKCGVFLKEKATDVEGIFRLNGSAKRIKDLQEVFDSPERYGKGLDWSGYTVHDAANVLRRYLNQLPEPIVPLEFYERFREPLRIYQRQVLEGKDTSDADKFDHAKAVETYQNLIIELPPLNKQLLLYILDLLAVFASKSDQNRMPSANLSAIFQPGMLSHPQHDMSPEEYKLSQDVLIFLIENQDHFLFGMSGTAADEQTMKEVEAGIPRPATHPTVRRSVSNASANTESHRKLDGIRRNVSVSSRNSRHSSNAQSPATPTSITGGGSSGGGVGVHRSNTLPSKMGPILTSARYTRANDTGSNNTPGLSVSNHGSRSTSRTPSVREEPEQPQPIPESISHPVPQPVSKQTSEQRPEQLPEQIPEQTPEQRTPSRSTASLTPGNVYVHTSTHGPLPPATAGRLSNSETTRPHESSNTAVPSTPAASPPQVVTPSRERKLSNFFTKSPPPDGELREPRQPNRLKKKRIPGSASLSAQSSANSLHAPSVDPSVDLEPKYENRSMEAAVGDTTPRPPTAATLGSQESPFDSNPALVEGTWQPHTDHSLRPHKSRTPSINSRSSFTDQSDMDQPEDVSRHENRRSWLFHLSSKRTSEQLGLGFASPPLVATNPRAGQSTSSFGSGHYQNTDLSSHPLSLDAGVQGSSSIGSDPEKKSLFGKFKAKVAQVRDGVRDDREHTLSPTRSETDPSLANQPLPPIATESINGNPASVEHPNEQPQEEHLRSPVSPLPGAGFPPSIPEEPHSPEMSTAVPVVERKESAQPPATESVLAPEPTVSHDLAKESAVLPTSAA
ncbi:Rho GTPase activator (Sac7), putative [Penicillium digitatum]|uniref:Rho GTPase activator (Sac7), putative n=3 Tax=Penicillium digitatum TaxID=36651 RepID=K9GFW4_PEND2|nr:Rho GTPase activator (Sac7), putative [Penicillium digitatum Pd1]EKV05346.1 Rho GTPase activator (Sac7), putative [Penicillium digitatum Pd1]EKV13673.1 Rho GTPase activator (Sac7), putative [Penicillium digitatum PHI26]QQK40290.1 Rho GTPase activator (Sac7), putative [Penicillium digitatum]